MTEQKLVRCEKCNFEVIRITWSQHVSCKNQLENDAETNRVYQI